MSERSVVVSGASGLIGKALIQQLAASGYRVRRLVRGAPASAAEIQWAPDAGTVEPAALEGCHAIVHLAGEPVTGRWTTAKKAAILASRVQGTRTLAAAIAKLESPPKVWVSASAVGYYGNRGAELLTEQSPPGADYLSEVCQAWEHETAPAVSVTRVVRARIGLVLSKDGGALERMLTPFRLGLGGNLADGRQYMSWITLRDTLRAFQHCLSRDSISGAVNFVGPKAVPNSEFTKTLAQVLKRPSLVAVPRFALKLGFGEFAAGILASQNVRPAALLASGFTFEDTELATALRSMLNAN